MVCELCKCGHDGSYGSGRFCSDKCARQFSSRKLIKKTKIVKCISCRVELEVDFRASDKMCKCSVCRKRHNRKMTPQPKTSNRCLWCGREVRNKFCNNGVCQKEHNWSVKRTAIVESNGIGHDIRQLKKYLIEIYGHKCSICGGDSWMGDAIPIIIDHINGRASDNRLENLRLVCGNCDAQLPTYKSKNKHSDRKRLGKYL